MSQLLNRFSIFSEISEEIKCEIKFFHVFNDRMGKLNVLFITSDDKVFGFGSNGFGCCGLGHNSVVNEPQIIPELCHKNIQQFFIGWSFFLGLTSDKRVFGWGKNTYGQLGRGYVSGKKEYSKPEIICFPFESVIQLSCGSDHTLALSCDGRVYGWGDNRFGQIGCGREKGKIITNPIHLQTFFTYSVKLFKKFNNRSYALTTEGLVYSWGHNNVFCCLGHELNENECVFEPKLINNIPKMQFLCPSGNNTYFLTNESELYFCGLSCNNKIKNLFQKTPILIKTEIKFSYLHSIPCYYSDGLLSAVYEKSIYRLLGNELRKYNNNSYFEYYSLNHKLCYKTIHINSENIFDGNDLNDLHNYKVFRNMFEIVGKLGTGGFGTVYKAINKFEKKESAIKEISFESKSIIFIYFVQYN